MDDDALTMAYVQKAIERYESEGLEATVAYYNSAESIEGERGLRIYDTESQTMLASGLFAGGERRKASLCRVTGRVGEFLRGRD